jgi:hypothetical protein
VQRSPSVSAHPDSLNVSIVHGERPCFLLNDP